MAESNVIKRICVHATAETAVPSLTDKGTPLAVTTWTAATWVPIGSIQRGDTADVHDDDVDISFLDEFAQVKPPLSLTVEDYALLSAGAESLSFMAYDGQEALLTLDSLMSVASHVAQIGTTLTYRAVCVEVNGLWIDYFPKCLLKVIPAGMGVKNSARTQIIARPVATSTILGGWQRHWLQPTA